MTSFVLPMPPSSNGLFANGKHGGRFRTQRYEDWIYAAGAEIMRQRPKKISGPVTLLYELQEPAGKRRYDLGNREKAVTDLLVSHQIIQADDNSVVREIRLKWSPNVEGVRVTVSSFFVASAYSETLSQGQPHGSYSHQDVSAANGLHGMRVRG